MLNHTVYYLASREECQQVNFRVAKAADSQDWGRELTGCSRLNPPPGVMGVTSPCDRLHGNGMRLRVA
jgi:hypothetical protein